MDSVNMDLREKGLFGEKTLNIDSHIEVGEGAEDEKEEAVVLVMS